jgi:small-conductance mechanosensitive channel
MLLLRWAGSWLSAGDPDCTRWRGVLGRVLEKTTVMFMVAGALDIVVTYAAVPGRIERLVDIFFIIAFALQGAIWARELILGVISHRAGEDSAETAVGNAMAIIRVLVSVVLFALAIIVILDNLGVNVTALIAGLGIGGIAIGLAAQGIFSDLFAALSILFDKPFRRGDTIRYGQSVGTVERIGLKTTRLRSLEGQQLVMANTKLLEQEISNFAVGHSRQTKFLFGIVYHTPPDQLEKVPELARSVVSSRSGCTLIRCAATGFGPSSIDFELLFDSASTDMEIVGADRTKIIADLMRMFATQGIEFAYPAQTTFTAAPDGKLVMPYAEVQPVVALEEDKRPSRKRQAKS